MQMLRQIYYTLILNKKKGCRRKPLQPLIYLALAWCPGAESNRRHEDFQSSALPTELPGLAKEMLLFQLFIFASTFFDIFLGLFYSLLIYNIIYFAFIIKKVLYDTLDLHLIVA